MVTLGEGAVSYKRGTPVPGGGPSSSILFDVLEGIRSNFNDSEALNLNLETIWASKLTDMRAKQVENSPIRTVHTLFPDSPYFIPKFDLFAVKFDRIAT